MLKIASSTAALLLWLATLVPGSEAQGNAPGQTQQNLTHYPRYQGGALPTAIDPLTGLPTNIDPMTGLPVKKEPVIKSIIFDGGSPEELIRALRLALRESDANAHGPNVLISPSMKDAKLPAFELQNVTFTDIFQALNNVSDTSSAGKWVLSGSSEPIWVLNPVQPPHTYGMPTPIPLSNYTPGSRPPSGTRVSSCQIFPVARFLTSFKIDDLTTAIETAWSLSPTVQKEPPGTLKFHKDTELLIVVGTQEELRLVTEVLTSLRQEIGEKEESASHPNKSADKAP
jgi:hypothetical protein